MPYVFPSGIQVFERGWLSSNNILLVGKDEAALIDSGYGTHSAQTLQLVQSALGSRPLDVLLNTHLHSDHCGGNAALQAQYPGLQTWIPPGHAAEVARWDMSALTYEATGQECPRFRYDDLLEPGTSVTIAHQVWEVHPAGGHDPHSVVLFQPENGILVSADALWEEGFGVVFPELEGVDAFDEVSATLDLLESLHPKVVIPGHGRPFTDVAKSLQTARSRLRYFIENPHKHQQYAAKVLLKFKLLDLQTCTMHELLEWGQQTPYLEQMRKECYPDLSMDALIETLLADLVRSGAAVRQGTYILNGK